MIKKAALLFSVLLTAVFIGGCWNYRGLNDMTIVVGIAIDKRDSGEGYKVTFEAVDLTVPVKTQGFRHQLLQSEGLTLFDAVRNAKKLNMNKLYFGHAQFTVISEDIARGSDLISVIDWYLRDSEMRETLCIAVSGEKTARELLAVTGPGESLISVELRKILETDNQVTSSTLSYELYQIYNILKSKGKSVVLPLVHVVHNEDTANVEVNGVAVYKGERMIGTLSPEDSKCLLFVVDKVEGGVLTFTSGKDGSIDASLEISRNRTSKSLRVKDGKPVITVKTETDVFLDEYKHSTYDLDKQEIIMLQTAAQQSLVQSIGDVIKKVQTEYGSDIFGFGEMVREQNPALWKTLEDKWDEIFPSLEVNVECKINIVNTAAVKE